MLQLNRGFRALCRVGLIASLLMPLAAAADVLITVASPGNVNDCGQFFATGNGFDTCAVNGAPVIIKYDGYEENNIHYGHTEINPLFAATVAEGDFQIQFDDNSNRDGVGTWTFDQQADDPSVTYWVAKGGRNGFNLHFVVADLVAASGVCAAAAAGGTTYDMLSVACLNAAIPVVQGRFITPDNQPGNPASLSHLTFYGSPNGSPITVQNAPLPSSLVLLLAAVGLFARTAVRYRRG